MNLKRIITVFSVTLGCAFASNDLTLVPTHTNGFERNLNPFDPTIGSFYATDFVYEPLWIFNVWNPGQDFPRLAESVSLGPNYRSVTYKLRQGVRWSDGTAFTADDVVFTVDYARKHPDFPINISLYSPSNETGLVARAVAVDSHTVRFDLITPSTMAHQSIGGLYPLPKHIFENVDDPVNFQNINPVGTGPFTQVDAFRTHYFKLCRNPYYYQNSDLDVDCLRFPQFAGNEQLWAAARLGKIDWMGEGIRSEEEFTSHKDTNKVWLAPGAAVVMQVNTARTPLNALPLRQALSMAINRQQLLDVDTFGLTSPMTWPAAAGPLFKSWADEQALQPYKYLMEYNPEAAMQLLDSAGYVDKDGDGWREAPNGQAIEIGIAVPSGWTDWLNSVLTMTKNFKAIGINTRAEAMDAQNWFERIPTGDFDLYMMWTSPGITPWNIYNEMFNTESMVEGRLGAQAMHQMQSTEVSKWLADFTLTDNKARQFELIRNVQLFVAEQLPVISLFANPVWYQYSDKRFTGWVTQDNPYVRPQVHRGTPERLIHVLNLKPVQ